MQINTTGPKTSADAVTAVSHEVREINKTRENNIFLNPHATATVGVFDISLEYQDYPNDLRSIGSMDITVAGELVKEWRSLGVKAVWLTPSGYDGPTFESSLFSAEE